MSTFFVKNEQINDNFIKITGDDANHIKNVLRYKIGDKLDICDENEKRYDTEITEFSGNDVLLKVISEKAYTTESPVFITLFQGLPKADKMELIIQKATELGVSEIVPVEMERSVVKLYGTKNDKKIERWNKIAYEASKQCGRQRIPHVLNVDILKNIIEKFSKYDIVLLPYEKESGKNLKQVLQSNQNVKNIAIVIGPEGGFSENDLAMLDLPNVESITLGPRILRTETAGIATLAMLSYEIEFER
ncbi:MAG: 16S rRNA (uracil(1498)-N(3))-methyltransferase [Clostridia bacterium]|nr:16S rRNA (uracil(1498)-N(3))-methyltransferase [Clostridia bacterium]